MEREAKRRKVILGSTMEGERVVLDFNLPDDILRIIFNHLSISERRIIGQVCKKWYEISRDPDPIFWKNVVVSIKFRKTLSMSERTMALLRLLPQCVTCLKLYFDHIFDDRHLNFSEFSSTLLNMCPNLEELIIVEAKFTDTEPLHVINLSNAFSQKLRVLKLREISNPRATRTTKEVKLIFDDSYVSGIEVFDIGLGDLYMEPIYLLQMPKLRELHLATLNLRRDFFDTILPVMQKLNVLDLQYLNTDGFRHILEIVRNNCFNLTELYLCFNEELEEMDAVDYFRNTAFPQLKVICLRGCGLPFPDINLIIDSRPSLELVYVGICTLNSPLYDEPEYDYTQCNSTKVIHRLNASFDDDCEHDERCTDFRNVI